MIITANLTQPYVPDYIKTYVSTEVTKLSNSPKRYIDMNEWLCDVKQFLDENVDRMIYLHRQAYPYHWNEFEWSLYLLDYFGVIGIAL